MDLMTWVWLGVALALLLIGPIVGWLCSREMKRRRNSTTIFSPHAADMLVGDIITMGGAKYRVDHVSSKGTLTVSHIDEEEES